MLVDVGFFEQLSGGLSNGRDVERALASVVMIEKALGNPGSSRDLVDGELIVALAREELEAEIEQLLTSDVDLEACACRLHRCDGV